MTVSRLKSQADAPVRLGLLGCGRIAQLVHLGVLTRLRGACLVAVADADPACREHAGKLAPQAALYADYAELLESERLDAVVIALPNQFHADAATAALGKGCHVYLEKPLASNLSEARRLLDCWRTSGLIGMIGFNYRFNRLYEEARRCIAAGRIGKMVAIRSVFSTACREQPAWKLARQNGGGVLMDLASHHMDLIRYLTGQEAQRVFAAIRSTRSEADSATVELTLADGTPTQSFFSFNAVDEDRFEIFGDRGKLVVERYLSSGIEFTPAKLDYIRLKRLWQKTRSLAHPFEAWRRLRWPGYEPSYQAALSHFSDAVRKQQPAAPDFRDGYRSLEILAAAEESAATGAVQPVRPAELSSGATDSTRVQQPLKVIDARIWRS